jgi:hypothetical protein
MWGKLLMRVLQGVPVPEAAGPGGRQRDGADGGGDPRGGRTPAVDHCHRDQQLHHVHGAHRCAHPVLVVLIVFWVGEGVPLLWTIDMEIGNSTTFMMRIGPIVCW